MRPAWLLAAASLLAGSVHAAPLTFSQALAAARESAPSLEARTDDLMSARSASRAAGRLPDPKLSFGMEGLPVTGADAGRPFRDEMSDIRLGVSQDMPSLTRRRAEREKARADIGAAATGRDAEARAVRLQTALAWIDLYYGARRLAALDESAKVIAKLHGAAPAMLASGAQRPGQSLEADRLTAVLTDRRADLRAAISRARANLARWTGDPAPETAGPPPAATVDAALLRERIDALPTLTAFDSMARQADADVALAEAGKTPDWSWDLAYQHRAPRFGDMMMAQVTVALPLFPSTRQDPIIDARRQTANRVRADRSAARRDLLASLDADLADHDAHRDRLTRARNLLTPLAERRADLETASYAAGTAALADVLGAALDLAESRLDRLDREATVARDEIRILFTYGTDDQ